jgi:hypothetical protein
MIRCGRALACAAAVLAAGCGMRPMKLPAGPGAPAPDGAAAFAQATAGCASLASLTAEASVSGRVGGQRLRAQLLVGVARPDRARIEAFAFEQPIFTFVASGGDATLLLTRDRRVLEHGAPDRVLEALTGAPLDGAELRTALTGCADANGIALDARRLADDWRLLSDAITDWYLHRDSGSAPWRLVAAVHRPPGRPGWRAEYRDFAADLPHDVRLASADRDRFQLRLRLSAPERNAPLGPDAFEVHVPPGVAPITLEELRASGPLASDDGP